MNSDHSWVTNDLFDGAMESIVAGMSAGEIIRIPGVHEILAEELNDDILDYLDNAREDSCRGAAGDD